MLQIHEISKEYRTDTLVQQALNKVSLNLRDNEFVAILGPSGSGKTTLLNIIGGLDRYDSGDLIINGISTKNYSDRDWDSYRNHTIGFVFQSYNLIPHQTILSNVELALTISGISSKERKEKATEALKKVGLGEHIHKRPNQLSGGQMQRVAIARALVNDPDILLADEPTGALDTKTSVQVMDLLKEVAKDRLVVMVTHNPELAEEYATRIVKLRDGVIIDDSDPFEVKESTSKPVHKNMGKSSMSLLTAFALSFNNLLTKKGRTLLTAFAGSIGIIGIALILSLSNGFQNYIDQIQEDTLTSYPLSITSDTADTTTALLSMVTDKGEEGNDSNIVEEKQLISSMFSSIGKNDLTSFKDYLEENKETVDEYVSLIDYTYSVSPQIYTKNKDNKITQVNPNTLLSTISGQSSLISSSMSSVFNEMIDDRETLEGQYDVLAGRWPEAYNEMILVLNDPNSINDMLVYSLGLRDNNELKDMIYKIMSNEKVENTNDPMSFTYDELLSLEYKLIDASETYKYNSKYDIYEDMSDDQEYMKNVYNNAIDLKIVGIVCSKEGSTSSALSPGVAYTQELTEYIIEKASESEIVKKQLANKEVNVFSNKRFDEETEDSGLDFQDMISIDTDMLASAFGSNISQETIANMTQGYMSEISSAIDADTSDAQELFSDTLESMATKLLNDYIEENKNDLGIATIKASDVESIVDEYLETNHAQSLLNTLAKEYSMPADVFKTMYKQLLTGVVQGYVSMVGSADDSMTSESILALINNAVEEGQIPEEIAQLVTDFLNNAESSDTDIITMLNEYLETDEAVALLAQLEAQYNIPADTLKTTLQQTLQNIADSQDNDETSAIITADVVEPLVSQMVSSDAMQEGLYQIAVSMSEATMQQTILSKVGELTGRLIQTMAESMNVDASKIAGAFQFNLTEDELSRLMETMTSTSVEVNANTNLLSLGYQDINEPTSISFYFKDFDSKEMFVDFLDEYNEKMEEIDEEKVIKYTDITGILMSSVSTIVDSVSYALIAFVSISLVVSSIMIGIITYISVLERTKEIGILRAIGASKSNISNIFNAETFIIGLCSGLIGIGVTLIANPLITKLIHHLTGNTAIIVEMPVIAAIILVLLSVTLTLISGFIPSKQAARKDPVTALRSE